MGNKIKYGLKNVHYAKLTENVVNGVTTYNYGAPIRIPGAVSLTLDAAGDESAFYADDMKYYATYANNGYSGDLEIAQIPESFRTDILQETLDSNDILVERALGAAPTRFALLFEFAGDVKATRHVMYNCIASRPSLESQTKEENIEPGTDTLSITADPRADGLVKARTSDNTDTTTYNNWYNGVYTPTSAGGVKLSNLTINGVALSPSFDPGTSFYTAETSDASNAITATADTGTVAIKLNGTSHTSGSAATWSTGVNSVIITVTSGSNVAIYAIVVRKVSA